VEACHGPASDRRRDGRSSRSSGATVVTVSSRLGPACVHEAIDPPDGKGGPNESPIGGRRRALPTGALSTIGAVDVADRGHPKIKIQKIKLITSLRRSVLWLENRGQNAERSPKNIVLAAANIVLRGGSSRGCIRESRILWAIRSGWFFGARRPGVFRRFRQSAVRSPRIGNEPLQAVTLVLAKLPTKLDGPVQFF
jgi:hypothetical protein